MSQITFLQAVSDAIREEMRENDKVFMIGEDMGVYGGCFGVTRGFLDEFGPERIIDTPISENGFTNMAIGAAMAGYRPIVEYMFSDFIAVAFDAIVNQGAKQRFMLGGQVKIPVVFRTPAGSGTGAAAQHSQSLEALVCHIPGLKVIMPSTPYDAKGLLKSAIRDDNPVLFFEHKLGYAVKGEVPDESYTLPIGKADIKREGKDITIISYSYTIHKCIEAAKLLEKDGIDAEVLDLRTLSPLDSKTIIESVKKTGRVLITHESVQKFGVGAEVASVIADSEAFFYLDRPIRRFGGEDIPIPYQPQLEKLVVPQVDSIYDAAKQLLK